LTKPSPDMAPSSHGGSNSRQLLRLDPPAMFQTRVPSLQRSRHVLEDGASANVFAIVDEGVKVGRRGGGEGDTAHARARVAIVGFDGSDVCDVVCLSARAVATIGDQDGY
jgi:hypothetical protein